MNRITRIAHPGWVPHRLRDGTYCLHSQLTDEPLNRKANQVCIATLEEVVRLLRTGQYSLRMPDRRRLLLAWRSDLPVASHRDFQVPPRVVLIHRDIEPRDGQPTNWASFNPNAGSITVWTRTTRTVPDFVLRTFLAHELAHAVIWSRGDHEQLQSKMSPDYAVSVSAYDSDPEELLVEQTLRSWGAPVAAARRWEAKLLNRRESR